MSLSKYYNISFADHYNDFRISGRSNIKISGYSSYTVPPIETAYEQSHKKIIVNN